MRSMLYAIVVGLAGAAVLHIVIILALPTFTGRDAYTRIRAFAEPNRFVALSSDAGPDATALLSDDPELRVAVCAFSTEEAPVRLLARGDVAFWSLAVFDSASNEVFSMNDRTSIDGTLDLVIATPIQLTALRKALPDALARSILVEMREEQGYAVLRTLVPSASHEPSARAFLSEAACEEFDSQ